MRCCFPSYDREEKREGKEARKQEFQERRMSKKCPEIPRERDDSHMAAWSESKACLPERMVPEKLGGGGLPKKTDLWKMTSRGTAESE